MVTGIVEAHMNGEAEIAASPTKHDKKLNRALGKIFAAASDGALPVDPALLKTFDKINQSKALSPEQKSDLFDAIIDRVAPEARANLSYSVFREVKDEAIKRHMANRVFGDIEFLEDSDKFATSLTTVKHVPVPSEQIAQRIVDSVDALPQSKQFDALAKLYERMPSYGNMVVDKMIDKVSAVPAVERHDLALMVYHLAATPELQERALAEALRHVDDAPVKNRTEKAVAISFLTGDPVLLSRAVDVAIDHATIANKSTIKALEESLKAIEELQGTPHEDAISNEQVMALETALYSLTEKPPAKPEPMNPSEFLTRIQRVPSP